MDQGDKAESEEEVSEEKTTAKKAEDLGRLAKAIRAYEPCLMKKVKLAMYERCSPAPHHLLNDLIVRGMNKEPHPHPRSNAHDHLTLTVTSTLI